MCVDANDNELAYLEAIHLFVEILGAFGLPIKVRVVQAAYTGYRRLL